MSKYIKKGGGAVQRVAVDKSRNYMSSSKTQIDSSIRASQSKTSSRPQTSVYSQKSHAKKISQQIQAHDIIKLGLQKRRSEIQSIEIPKSRNNNIQQSQTTQNLID
jgi:high-affinity K+ transport system ATPase subunit B